MKIFKMLLPGLAILMMVNCVFAQTWTQTSAPSNNWISVASSADGNKLVAVAVILGSFNLGPIYILTNSGTTWTLTSAPSNFWHSVVSSADGTKLVAVGSNPSFSQGVIFTSTDSGISWAQAIAPNIGPYVLSIASSADGAKLATIGGNLGTADLIYTSTNSGITWTQTSAPSTNWFSIASSAVGNTLVAVVNSTTSISNTLIGGPIYVSTNSGTTWAESGTISGTYLGWHAVASSADGTKMAAVDLNHVFTSTDSGMSWAQASPMISFVSSIASSADGKN